jgi:uncharacterized protein YkwD
MRPIHRIVAGVVSGLVLAPPLLVAPAGAVAAPRVSISISDRSVSLGDAVEIRGKVTPRSVGVRVQLQRKVGIAWRVVTTTRVRQDKSYSFRVVPPAGTTRFRAKTVGNRQLRSGVSLAVAVRAIRDVTPPPTLNAVQRMILDQTNQERTARGLSPLVYSEGVEDAAQPWAEHMAATQTLEHNPNYSSQIPDGWSAAAENIAEGYAPDAVVAAWMASAGHRENILGDYTHLGVGYAVAADGTPYYVQNFGKY